MSSNQKVIIFLIPFSLQKCALLFLSLYLEEIINYFIFYANILVDKLIIRIERIPYFLINCGFNFFLILNTA